MNICASPLIHGHYGLYLLNCKLICSFGGLGVRYILKKVKLTFKKVRFTFSKVSFTFLKVSCLFFCVIGLVETEKLVEGVSEGVVKGTFTPKPA